MINALVATGRAIGAVIIAVLLFILWCILRPFGLSRWIVKLQRRMR